MPWRVATFNVNGVRARLPIVLDWLDRRKPDVLCLQEIKCQDDQFPVDPFREAGWRVALRGQKAFNGVAIVSKEEPDEVARGFDEDGWDEARFIAARMGGVWVANTYVPQGRDPADPAFQQKLGFFGALRRWLDARFTPGAPLVWLGDLNVAPEPLDVYDPKRLDGKVGFHPDERRTLAETASWGFYDLFRVHHPEEKQFTFWDYRLPKSLERGLGWRIDHIMATAPMRDASLCCEVDEEPRGMKSPSDHTPVWADFDLEKLQS
jgi:exodeoxyribonuclease-3